MGFSPGPGSGGSSSIAGSSDVSLNSPQNNQALTYNSGSSKWQNSSVVGSLSYAVASNTNGTWPTFASVYPGVSLPLPSNTQVMWYVRSSEQNATIPAQFEDIDASSRPIGGLHALWGYPWDGDSSTG